MAQVIMKWLNTGKSTVIRGATQHFANRLMTKTRTYYECLGKDNNRSRQA